MRFTSTARNVCLLASSLCIVAAYMLVGYWEILPAMLAIALFWSVARKWSPFWPSSSLLAIYLLLAMAGVALKAPLLVLLTGCVFALACWDLTDFAEELVGNTAPRARALMEKRRLQSLALMIGISLSLAMVQPWLRLQLPFGVIVLLVMLVAGLMLYGVYRLRRSAG